MEGFVKIPDFMDYLRENRLVIVPQDMVLESREARIAKLRRRLNRKAALTLKEICDAELLTVRSKQGLRTWIENGTIRPGEHDTSTRGVIRIMREALLRLGADFGT